MTEQERKRRIEAVKESARRTDEMRERNRLKRELTVARLERSIERLLRTR